MKNYFIRLYLRMPTHQEKIAALNKQGKEPTPAELKKLKADWEKENRQSKTPVPVHLSLRWDGNRVVINTGGEVAPVHWHFPNKGSKGDSQRPKNLPLNEKARKLVNEMTSKIEAFFDEYRLGPDKRNPSLTEFKERFGKQGRQTGFFEHFKEFMDRRADIMRREGKEPYKAPSKLRGYRRTRDLLMEWNPDLTFHDLNSDFPAAWETWLIKKHKFALNTIGGHMACLKTVMNDAYRRRLVDDWLRYKPDYVARAETVDHIYLNRDELEEMHSLDLSKEPYLANARDMFLLGCYTGLRYSDYRRLNLEDRNGDYIDITTQKTKTRIALEVTPEIQDIFTRNGNQVLRHISNQKLNKYLKIVAGRCKLLDQDIEFTRTQAGQKETTKHKKYNLVTTHTARRSFATNELLDGIPAYIIMRHTGHTSDTTFYDYVKLSPREFAEERKRRREQAQKDNGHLKAV